MDEREPRDKRACAHLARGVGGAQRRKTKGKRAFRRGWCEGEEEEEVVVAVEEEEEEEEEDGRGGVGGDEARSATMRDESAPVVGRPRRTSRLMPARRRVA